MMKEKINNNKKYIKETIFILLGGLLINLACFLLCFLTGHCATIDTTQYFPMSQGDGEITQDIMALITQYDSDLQWSAHSGDEWYRFVFAHQQYNSQGVGGTVSIGVVYSITEPKAELNSDNHTFYIENLATIINGAHAYELVRYSNGTVYTYNRDSWLNNGRMNQALQSSQYHPNTNSDRFSYYSNFTLLFYQNNDVCLIGPTLNIGDFTDLPSIDNILNNINNSWEPPSNITGHALPSQPTENPNNNDFQNRLQMFDYLKDTLTALIGNLGYNLANWFNALIGKLVEGFNSVSQNIYNGFKTLMDNIKEFFGPKIDAIIDKFNYITEPFDSKKLADSLNNGDFSSDFLGLITTVSTFANTFTSATEPQSCSFTLDLRNNGYFSFGLLTFSFDWILPFRSTIRLILGCLCVYSLIVSIFTSINTYIGGTSSINDDI